MEDYEKKYKDALERAKIELNADTTQGTKNVLMTVFPELAEPEDERIRKDLIQWINEFPDTIWRGHYKKDIVAWLEKQCYTKKDVDDAYLKGIIDAKNELEKQGEKKTAVTDFNAKDWYVSKVDGKIHDMTYNPADKIEPKFKVGDWIAHNTTNTTYCIDDISDGRYYITRSNGDKTYNSIKMVEDHAHLWSIKDAKPGDILASSRSIFIFKGIYMADKPEAYCGVWDDFFIETHEGCWTNERCYPATKEQQRLLFEKITEAGYEWKEKVLNKIKMQDLVISENNVTKISDQDKWGDEDIKMLNTVINIFEKVYPSNYFTTFVTGSESPTLINSPEIVKWLKGIKQKALGKLKFTKEDIEALRIAIINLGDMAEVDAINNFNMTFGEAKEKLIEIKDRYTE